MSAESVLSNMAQNTQQILSLTMYPMLKELRRFVCVYLFVCIKQAKKMARCDHWNLDVHFEQREAGVLFRPRQHDPQSIAGAAGV